MIYWKKSWFRYPLHMNPAGQVHASVVGYEA